MATLEGNEVWSNSTPASQVYQATHEGELRLPFMNRSFISFTFGDKHIEDFNLIAYTKGDRISKNGYASFNDLTTTYEIIPGQFYWGTHYSTNSLNLELATDGMTQKQLDNFLYWFGAGNIRELILSEHPNRAIMARVSSPPVIQMLPFEKQISVPIGNDEYRITSTTLYKGEIQLEFVMDEPHWYSKINIFGKPIDGVYYDTWIDANGNEVSVFNDPDAVKISYEDGIPFSSMIGESMILGDETYANVDYDNQPHFCIATMQEEELSFDVASATWLVRETYVKGAVIVADSEEHNIHGSPIIYTNPDLEGTEYNRYVIIEGGVPKTKIEMAVKTPQLTTGLIAGPQMSRGTGVLSLDSILNNGVNYFYYAGTAPSPIELEFTLTPSLNNNYISSPNNSYILSSEGLPYNTLTIEGLTKQELRFTTCNFYTSFNKVIALFRAIEIGQDWAAVREDIRIDVHHAAVRAWANRVIDYLDNLNNGTGIIVNGQSDSAARLMGFLVMDMDGNLLPSTYTFNSKTGEAKAQLQYRTTIVNSQEAALPTRENQWRTYGQVITKEEDVGDMLKSNYLIIRDRNYPDESTGKILHWTEDDKTRSHKIYHNVNGALNNIKVIYQNLYL